MVNIKIKINTGHCVTSEDEEGIFYLRRFVSVCILASEAKSTLAFSRVYG
jgi:hypothetical protein